MKKFFPVVVLIALAEISFAQNCPVISVKADSAIILTGKTFVCKAVLKEKPANTPVTYNWSISTGTIIAGQGTAAITIDPGNDPGSCTASVEIAGLKAGCRDFASETVSIKKATQKFSDTKTVTAAGINAAINKFIIQTEFKNPNLAQNAIVCIYAASLKQFTQLKILVEKTFEQNQIYSYRYKIINAGINKQAFVELLLDSEM